MTDEAKLPGPAWQPLTTGGVAAFARASRGRLWLVESCVSVLVSAAVVWFLATAWFPVITDALAQLPDRGGISRGRLVWPGTSPVALAHNPFLSIGVDVQRGGEPGPFSDVQWVFGPAGVDFCSLLGCWEVGYPTGWTISLNRAEVEPWWGAWRPAILAALGVLMVVGLLVIWGLLASIYAVPVRAMAFFLDRDVSRGGCWRLASAALMPGALLLGVAMVLYGRQRLNLAGLIGVVGLHLVVGWVYAVLAALRLPRLGAAGNQVRNPFDAPTPRTKPESAPEKES